MASADTQVIVVVTADTKEYEQNINKAEKDTKSKFEGLQKFGEKTFAAIGAAAAAVGAAAVVVGKQTWSMANEVAAAGDEIEKNSQKVGLSYEAYQKWDYAMKISGTEMSACTVGLKTLTNTFDDATNGTQSAIDKFDRLGISMDDIKDMSREDVFATVVNALQNVTDETEKAAIANDFFGRSGQELIPLFNLTADELQGLMDDAENYGMVMSDDAVEASAAFEDSLTKLKGTVGGVKNELIGGLLPSFSQVMDGLSDLVAGNEGASEEIKQGVNGLISEITSIIPQAVELIGTVLNALVENAPDLMAALADGVLLALDGLVQQLPTLLPKIIQVLLQIIKSIIKMLPSLIRQIGQALVVAIPILVSAIAELITILAQEIPNIIDALIEVIPQILMALCDAIVENLPIIIEAVINLVLAIIQRVPDIIQMLADCLPEIVEKLVESLLNNLPTIIWGIIQIVVAIVKALPKILESIWNLITGLIGGFVKGLTANTETRKWIEVAIEWVESLIQGIKDWWDNLVKTVKDFVTGLISKIGEWILGVVQKGRDFVDNIKKGIQEKWDGFKENVRTKVTGIVESIGTWFSSLLGKGKAAISNLWTGISERWTTMREAIKGRVTTVVDSIGSWFASLYTKGKDAIAQLWNGISERFSGIVRDVGGKVNSIIEQIRAVFTGLWSTGWNAVKGLWQGISDGWGWLTGKVRQLAKDLLRSVKDTLGIKSPSKEFAIIGKYIDEGLSDGIDAFERVPLKAVRQLALDVIDDFGVPDITGSLNGAAVLSAQNAININATWSGTLECDGYTLGQVVLRNIDDAAAFTLRG